VLRLWGSGAEGEERAVFSPGSSVNLFYSIHNLATIASTNCEVLAVPPTSLVQLRLS
jgi:hypothetical protein